MRRLIDIRRRLIDNLRMLIDIRRRLIDNMRRLIDIRRRFMSFGNILIGYKTLKVLKTIYHDTAVFSC
jgi:hypothetical protein